MTVSAAEIQSLIVQEVGDTDDGALALQMDTIWDAYADKAPVFPRLQELYAKRRAIDIVLGSVRDEVDESTDGTSLRQTQRVTHLLKMRDTAEAEIKALEARAAANRAGVLAAISTTAPVAAPGPLPTFGPLDGNDMAISGSPYRSLRGVIR